MLRPSRFSNMARWLLLLTALVTAGCSAPADRYFPLGSGRLWVYALTVTTGQGTRSLKHVVTDLGHGYLDGHKVYIQQFANGVARYFRVEPKGIFAVAQSLPGRRIEAFRAPRMVMPRRPRTSSPPWTDWEYTRVLQRGGPPKANLHIDIHVRMQITYVVRSSDSSVEVPAGRFSHCLRVQGTGETQRDVGSPIGPVTIRVKDTRWYAPGTGLVKVVRTEKTSSPIVPPGKLSMELEEVRAG